MERIILAIMQYLYDVPKHSVTWGKSTVPEVTYISFEPFMRTPLSLGEDKRLMWDREKGEVAKRNSILMLMVLMPFICVKAMQINGS